jgi:hypothetical protein
LWVTGEYLLWGIKDTHLPPLVTMSTTPNANGIIGVGDTTVLLGGGDFDIGMFSGGRFSLGGWLDRCQTWGLEGSFLFLDQRSNVFGTGGDGTPGSATVARPFINAVTGAQTSELVAAPGLLAGTVVVAQTSSLIGAEANARWRNNGGPTCGGLCYRLDLLAGVHYLELRESLGITENLSIAPGFLTQQGILGPATILVHDQFKTTNDFYGGQVGADFELRRGGWFLDVTGKLALGTVRQTVNINGTTTFIQNGVISGPFAGGLLAQPGTNIGQFGRNKFAVLPEIGIKLGFNVTESLRVFAAYNFLYLSSVVRPGDQIDPRVNPALLLKGFGPISVPAAVAHPAFNFKETDFWAQGASFGFEYRY